VALGMIFAVELSERVLKLPTNIKTRLVALLDRFGLPHQLDRNLEVYLPFLRRDKKVQQQEMNFILLRDIGLAERQMVTEKELREFLSTTEGGLA
jgi:3-dehydroquinate synthetase